MLKIQQRNIPAGAITETQIGAGAIVGSQISSARNVEAVVYVTSTRVSIHGRLPFRAIRNVVMHWLRSRLAARGKAAGRPERGLHPE
jgi:hypothetical protein